MAKIQPDIRALLEANGLWKEFYRARTQINSNRDKSAKERRLAVDALLESFIRRCPGNEGIEVSKSVSKTKVSVPKDTSSVDITKLLNKQEIDDLQQRSADPQRIIQWVCAAFLTKFADIDFKDAPHILAVNSYLTYRHNQELFFKEFVTKSMKDIKNAKEENYDGENLADLCDEVLEMSREAKLNELEWFKELECKSAM